MQLLLWNSWVVYRCFNGEKDFLKFEESAIRHLVLNSGISKHKRVRLQITNAAENVAKIGHLPQRIASRTSHSRPAKRCRECYKRGICKESIFECRNCDGNPGLCIEPCFAIYHA